MCLNVGTLFPTLPISSTILFRCLFLNLAFFLFRFHVISCSIYLVYFTWHKALQIQLCVAYGRISFFFKGWLMYRLKYVCCVCVSHFHIIHSSVDTYLGCFHALVIVTNTTMNVDVWMPFWHTDFIFFECEVGLQDYIEVLLWFSWGIAVVVSIVPVPVYIPAKCTRDPFSPHPHHKFYLFDDRHLNRYDVIAQCGFDLLFLRD